MQDNIFYIHTTSTIIDYITMLSKRYMPNRRIFHILDESMLYDIKQGDRSSAQTKLENAIMGGLHSGAKQFMITCTSTGQLIDKLDPAITKNIKRIEDAAVAQIKRRPGKTGIVYTNPTVWPEMQIIMKRSGIEEASFMPCFIDRAFDAILSGDVATHDKLISDYLTEQAGVVDSSLLAQVSICSTMERLSRLKDSDKVISIAELGIESLRENDHA